jgi:ketosteroid isomerase-like protein
VALERSRYQRAAVDSVRTGYTRATHIFRRENGEWKLAHRHMDHIEEAPRKPGP